jgi:hypothetical protein
MVIMLQHTVLAARPKCIKLMSAYRLPPPPFAAYVVKGTSWKQHGYKDGGQLAQQLPAVHQLAAVHFRH